MTTSQRPTAWQDLLSFGRSVRLALSSPETRAKRAYEIFPPSTWTALNDHSSYLNFGYWRSEADTLDDACQALAEKLADAAGFQEGDRILDAGFGYGDQDFMWLERHNPAKIVGLNVTPTHVQIAQAKARERGLSDRLIFQEGSATAMTFEPSSFDRVVALESALHFRPREEFFRQAHHILRPGGVLATADILPLNDYSREDLFSPTVPRENWHDGNEYLARLRSAGFVNARLTSIRTHVYEQWCRWAERKLDAPEFQQNATWGYRRWLHRELADDTRMRRRFANMDYVIVVAEKPM
ncbi:methyltransferase domain-containing protein [Streptosporangium sp. NPDC049644]|uniref:methyltransferase domain-containing protein n=1 Tax=Streptosporangium sp. NPDC049644 TaxID=3155507 RepID=UPI0034155F03